MTLRILLKRTNDGEKNYIRKNLLFKEEDKLDLELPVF